MKVFAESGTPIVDLLIADWMMPGMSGPDWWRNCASKTQS